MAIRAAARHGLRVRAGVHAGKCERIADSVAHIAVQIAARISAFAAADEVLTTSTVGELLLGSPRVRTRPSRRDVGARQHQRRL
jgi:class 3 adenylate cyclase